MQNKTKKRSPATARSKKATSGRKSSMQASSGGGEEEEFEGGRCPTCGSRCEGGESARGRGSWEQSASDDRTYGSGRRQYMDEDESHYGGMRGGQGRYAGGGHRRMTEWEDEGSRYGREERPYRSGRGEEQERYSRSDGEGMGYEGMPRSSRGGRGWRNDDDWR
jgi:hypothetical protein